MLALHLCRGHAQDLYKECPGACILAGATYSTIQHTYQSIAIPISYHRYT